MIKQSQIHAQVFQILSAYQDILFLVHSEHPSSWKRPLKINHGVLCIHLATSGQRAHFTQLLRGDSSISSCSSTREEPSGRQCWLGALAEANSRGFLLIRGAATGLHSSASSSSQNTQWKQLWTALEGLSEGKGGEVCILPQSKHALHENNMAGLPMPFHTALKLILLSVKAYSCAICCICFSPVCSYAVIWVFMPILSSVTSTI